TNASGKIVKPTKESEEEALSSIDLGPDLIGSNPNPKVGYPIVTFSWVLLYQSGNGSKHDTIDKVFGYTLSEPAQAMAGDLGFISHPAPVLERSRAALATVKP
ncbi:MAG: phosphate ABC transporter substrate-binding protein PstS, partial [Cyanobium sp.]